ncbi:MAG: hypothetical protein SFV24_17285 [Gemmatimonadales bacterium]|nr:hypothetical protein [Gemmatimonadales bacterium]
MTFRSHALRAIAVASMLGAAGCSTDSILTVDRPDIIDPGRLVGTTGAAALYAGGMGEIAYSQGGNFAGFMLLSGLFSDEFRFGGTPPEVREMDLGGIRPENSFAQVIWLNLHRGRRAAERSAEAILAISAGDKRAGELYALSGLSVIWIAEMYCSGAPLSKDAPDIVYGSNVTTNQMLDSAIARLNLAAASTGSDANIVNLIAVLRGRALLNKGQFAAAGAAVASVPTGYSYALQFSAAEARTQNAMKGYIYDFDYMSVSDVEGGNGLNFASANDPRVPVTQDFGPVSRFDGRTPMFQFTAYNSFNAPIVNASGIEARLIEAEAALQAGNTGTWLSKLNEARATRSGLAPLTDPGTAAARVDLLFRERAFWMFGTGHRLGDMRRLVRQYNRTSTSVFPTGNYHKDSLIRGNQASVRVSIDELNNPSYDASQCDPTKA